MNDQLETQPFLMFVENILKLGKHNNEVLVSGRIVRGKCEAGDTVDILGLDHPTTTTTVISLDTTISNDKDGLILKIDLEAVQDFMMVAHTGTIQPHKRFKGQVRFLETEDGGRKEPLVLAVGYAQAFHYRPLCYLYGKPFGSSVTHPDANSLNYFEVLPGEELDLHITLMSTVPVEIGTKFQLADGPRYIIAEGMITEIYE